ncbi:MAG: FliM/FliN family flagellar motor switch protein [Acidobacteriota bacterium]
MTILEQIAHFANVPIDLEVELGRKTMTLQSLLTLQKGSLIKLPRSAGENIAILAGGVPLGSGEIVIIEERFGVRITDFKEEE